MGSALGLFFQWGLVIVRLDPCFFLSTLQAHRGSLGPICFLNGRNVPTSSCDALGQQTHAQPHSRTPIHPNTPTIQP